jgi:hypothetical protein
VNRPMTLVDRVRIERVLWTVDFLIHDIRTRGRRTIRRELRANLQAAAQERGAAAAIRQLGSLRVLARGYLDAQYGEGALQPRWLAALWWFSCAPSSSLRSRPPVWSASGRGCARQVPVTAGPTCGLSCRASGDPRPRSASPAAGRFAWSCPSPGHSCSTSQAPRYSAAASGGP